MEFRILGPLEVIDTDGVVALRGRHQPKLLAVLLLEAGHVVPLHRLVDALWDDDPPDTAGRQVQNGMAALRRVLAARGSDPIESVTGGYRLTTDNLDARLFAAEVAEASTYVDAGDHVRAHAVLCRALDRWRGPALAGMPGRLLASAAASWDERRLVAQELRMEAELAMGQPGRAVGEARALLDANPYRQGTAALLMSALHRSGRTAEALSTYDLLRTRLADDLGIDPGVSLQNLHRDILRQNTSVEHEAPAVAPAPVPAQLPVDSPLVGRTGQLAALDRLVADGATSAVIVGPAGVGKTALAVHWAHRHAAHRHTDRFCDGQLFINMRGYDHTDALTAGDALDRSLRALGYPADRVPADGDEASALLRSILSGRRVLLVLDNVRTVDQVRPLLPAVPGSFTLITSRDRLTGLVALDGVRSVPLDVLDRSESATLLEATAGIERSTTDAAVERIVDLCGRLPLALRIVGANLATRPHMSLTDLADELDGSDRLDRLAIPGDAQATVADSIGLSLGTLDSDTRRFFLLLSLIPAPTFADGLAAAVNDVAERDARRHVERLLDAHLLQRHSGDRSRFHDLVRLYGRRCAVTELDAETIRRAQTNVLEWYGKPVSGESHEDIMAVIAGLADHPRVWRAAMGLQTSVHAGYDAALLRDVANACLVVARRNGDLSGQSAMQNLIAGTHWAAREMDLAEKAEMIAVRLAREAGDDILLGRHLSNMAEFAVMRGDHAAAASIIEDALEVSRRTGSAYAIAARLSSRGEVRARLGQYEAARQDLLDSLDWVHRGPDRDFKSTAVPLKLAEFYFDWGRYDECARYIAQTAAGDPQSRQWRTRVLRGRLLLATGDVAAGHDELTAVYEEERANRHVASAAALLQPMAESALLLNRYEQARRFAEDCLRLGEDNEQVHDRAAGHLLLCRVHNGLQDYGSAIFHGQKARSLYTAMPEPLREGRALAALSVSYAGLGDDRAKECRQGAVEIFERLGVTATEKVPAPTAEPGDR